MIASEWVWLTLHSARQILFLVTDARIWRRRGSARHHDGQTCRLHPDRAADRRRDHRHSGDDRDSEISEHEGQGLRDVDQVRPPQPATAEEAYLFDNDTYTSALTDLNYQRSPGVVVNITNATASGWSATATHPQSFPLTCAIFMGSATAQPPATVEGLIGCQ